MTNLKANSRMVEELIGQIENEDLHLIDFDNAKKKLREIQIVLQKFEHTQSELSQLREDYQNRIAGMVKAITTLNRDEHKSEEALDYLDNLVELSAGELINEYRKTSARFRSAFPTSFGLFAASSNGKRRMKNPEVYK